MNSLFERIWHHRRWHRRGKQLVDRKAAFRRLVTETLEDRHLLAAVPVLSISDVTAAEGDTETTDFTFVVSLSEASSQQIAVDVTSSGNSATLANEDFLPVSPILRGTEDGRVVVETDSTPTKMVAPTAQSRCGQK